MAAAKQYMHVFYFTAPYERPRFDLIKQFVWVNGEHIDTDTDGNSFRPDSTDWTELTVETRDYQERFDVDPVQDDPLILKIRSEERYLAARVAYVLAVY